MATKNLYVPPSLAKVINANPEVNWSALFQAAIKHWQKEQTCDTLGLQLRYFVLDPKGDDAHARASRAAMRAYAFSIRERNQTLAFELIEWTEREMDAAVAEEKAANAQGSSVERTERDGGVGPPEDDGEGPAN